MTKTVSEVSMFEELIQEPPEPKQKNKTKQESKLEKATDKSLEVNLSYLPLASLAFCPRC